MRGLKFDKKRLAGLASGALLATGLGLSAVGKNAERDGRVTAETQALVADLQALS